MKIYKLIKKVINKNIGNLFYKDEKYIDSLIFNSCVVSFDIFDTLVKRNIPSPEKLFWLVQEEYKNRTGAQITNYLEIRIRAEEKARKLNIKEEVTIEEIYDNIDKSVHCDIRLLKEIEQELEIGICCPNLRIKPFFEKAIQEGKHVIITSDMYLPEKTINCILKKCGYEGYERLYLSSTYGKTKSTGNLFTHVLQDYEKNIGAICHIGDNIKGDFFVPKKMGINAFLICGDDSSLKFWKKRSKVYKKSVECQILYEFIKNHKEVTDDELAEAIGYEVLGPMLLGYIQWLHKKIREDNIDKLFFLSREGALMKKAYNVVFPESDIYQCYLYVSRQALLVPLLYESNNYDDMLQVVKFMIHTPSLENIGKVCLLETQLYYEELDKIGLDKNLNIFDIPDSKKEAFYYIVSKLGLRQYKEQKGLLQQYLKEKSFYGNLAISDIGWQGTMQMALLHYINKQQTTMRGYYLGVRNVINEDIYAQIKREGYLFTPEEHYENGLKLRFTNEVIEILFLNSAGSVRRYEKKRDEIEPELGKSEYFGKNEQIINQIQESSIRFLNDIKKNDILCEKFQISSDIVMLPYENFAIYPSLRTVNYFKDFYFLDGGGMLKKLLPAHHLGFYILHPKVLAYDLNDSICKIYFLRNLFKIRLPYYKLIKFLVCGLHIRSKYLKNMEKK